MSENQFLVSTGDIRGRYTVIDIVATRIQTFSDKHFERACHEAVANLRDAARKLGGDGLIWIHLRPVDVGGFGVFATGTAVRLEV